MKKFSERINMEICYVPVAKLKDVQEMMANWRKNNKTIRVSAIAAIFMSFVNLCYLILAETSLNSEIPVIICALSMLLLVLEAVIVTTSIKWGQKPPLLSLDHSVEFHRGGPWLGAGGW